MNSIPRLQHFVQSLTSVIESSSGDEARILAEGRTLLGGLIAEDDWLPERFARPDLQRYQQYLLYCDPQQRFSVVSFVWGPGHTTPVHDHTVWGMVGVMRGAETCEEFAVDAATGRLRATGTHRLDRGGVDLVSPRIGDIHKVSNALDDQVSVSIHVYGADIGRVKRHVYDPDTGVVKDFISGYSTP